jgi:hypothetical protein
MKKLWTVVLKDEGYPDTSAPIPGFFQPKKEQVKMEQGLDFGRALERLKDGEVVTREGWNGKGMFIYLVQGSTFAVNRPPLSGLFPEGTEINYRAHIDMKTADGSCVPWIASQSDLLADDWLVTTAHAEPADKIGEAFPGSETIAEADDDAG